MQNILLSPDLIVRCLLGFAVGALIGLERQKRLTDEASIGVRSFGLHSLLGTLAAYSYIITGDPATGMPGNPIVLIYATAISVILVGSHLVYKVFRTMRKGLTTTVVFALAFVLGTLVGLDPVPPHGQIIGPLQLLAMTVSFFVFLVLGFKEELSAVIAGIQKEEMISAVELGVVIFFLWPLIPETVTVGVIQFPIFQVYILIVILLAISFVNYILVKKYKDRGSYFFGFFGGFANSEATVTSLTDYYVNTDREHPGRISLSIIFANLSMVLRNGLLLVILDPSLSVFSYYLPPIVILIILGLFRLFTEQKELIEDEKGEMDTRLVSPFEFGAAFRFAVVFVGISFVSLVLQEFFGERGILFAAVIGGFASSGAVVAAAVPLFVSGSISLTTTVYAVIIATTMSVLNKMIYVYSVDRETRLLDIVGRDSLIMAFGVCVYIVVLWIGIYPIS